MIDDGLVAATWSASDPPTGAASHRDRARRKYSHAQRSAASIPSNQREQGRLDAISS
jgi:hypothetical protein